MCFDPAKEILTKMDENELKIKVSCGAIVKELDPAVPPNVQEDLGDDDKIHRDKFTQLMGSAALVVTKEQKKTDEATGDKVHCFVNKQFLTKHHFCICRSAHTPGARQPSTASKMWSMAFSKHQE